MLDGKYRVERLLATGGMGAVYLGTHIGLRKRVAIKLLNPQLSSASMIERFHREAVTASQIGHEGIAQVTDLGTSRNGEPFLVMEYLEGESLASRLAAIGRMDLEDACELGCAILSPLAAAHRAGIVHRDLKPDNVFLVRQSRGEMVKLLDFGISRRARQDGDFRLTTTGLVLGTPFYMSPEQARGESEITPAADLYAFGVILYEMLTGDVPIRADNYNQLMYRVTIGDYLPPRARRPELPETLEYLIVRAMAQTPAERPGSAGEIEDALLPFCRPVFRDHATGRIRGSQLPLRAGGLAPSASTADRDIPDDPTAADTDRAMFSGPTLSDSSSGHEPAAPNHRTNPPHPTAPPGSPGPGDDTDPSANRSAAFHPPAATARAASPHRGRHAFIGLAVAAVGGAIAAGLVLTRSDDADRHAAVAAAAPPARPPAAEPAPGPAPPRATPPAPAPPGEHASTVTAQPAAQAAGTIALELVVDPAGAAAAIDGQPVAGGVLTLPRDGALHRLQITAAGYVRYDEAIRFDESQRLIVQLRRAAPPVRSKPARKDPATERTDRIESQSPYQ